jgi:hypothetical protein
MQNETTNWMWVQACKAAETAEKLLFSRRKPYSKNIPLFLKEDVDLGQFEPVLNRGGHDNAYLWPGLLFPSLS